MSAQFDHAADSFLKLLKTVSQLRDPVTGCPWDKEQTHQSLLPYLLEEAQEYIAVVNNGEQSKMKEELADILFQIILHTQLAYENKLFSIAELCETLNEKLIQRHPHVFTPSTSKISTADEVKTQWNKNKATQHGLEKLEEAIKLPSLLAAHKIGSYTNGVGFDWENAAQVLQKVEEEFLEVKMAMDLKIHQKEKCEEELGDLLFSVVQLARHLNLSADYCLNFANQKFYQRFLKLNEKVKTQKKDLRQMSLEEKEKFWQEVKEMTHDKK